MKRNEPNDEVDTLIRDALGREEAEFFDRLGPPDLLEMMTETFRGRLGWLSIMTSIFAVVFFALSVWCAVRFVQATEPVALIRWGTALGFSFAATMSIKIWYWMDMNRHLTTREIKRLELQVAHLSAQLQEGA